MLAKLLMQNNLSKCKVCQALASFLPSWEQSAVWGSHLCNQRRPMWDLGALFLHIWHGETSTVNKSTLARSKGMLLRNIASGSRLRGSVRRARHCPVSYRRFHHRAWSWRCLCGNGQRSKKKKKKKSWERVF